MFIITEEWQITYPEAKVGFLVMHGVNNPESHPVLDQHKANLEQNLRARFGGLEPSVLENLLPIRAYSSYYRRYKKTYHILLQLQSLIYQGKSIPSGSGLVEAMFMAEMQNQLLTAAHDLNQLELPVTVGVSSGEEHYTLLRGDEQQVKQSDMFMADKQGVISSLIYGPDQRTRITSTTERVLFAVYAVPGISETMIYEHLRNIQETVKLFSPDASLERMEIFPS